MTKTNWIDISQPLTNDMAHWPGDEPFTYSPTLTKEQSGSVNIGQMSASLHTGTHVDAPFHYDSNGQTIDQLDLERYIGTARVIDVSHNDTISVKTLDKLAWNDCPERLLLYTSLPNNPKRFPDAYPVMEVDVAPFLREKGVRLLGIDAPSVDTVESKDLPIHHALYNQDINILENIMLDDVQPGDYELIALPLAIQGADGSPVRAVIRPIHAEKEN
ncbi:MAG TPA: arylformamidase [Virgibacillus sp.]|nr:arylformamidase [Virgibacillus sp.]